MQRNQWRKGAWESASGNVGAMSPSHSSSLALALLLISAIPPCTGTSISIFISYSTQNSFCIYVYPYFIARSAARARNGESVRNLV